MGAGGRAGGGGSDGHDAPAGHDDGDAGRRTCDGSNLEADCSHSSCECVADEAHWPTCLEVLSVAADAARRAVLSDLFEGSEPHVALNWRTLPSRIKGDLYGKEFKLLRAAEAEMGATGAGVDARVLCRRREESVGTFESIRTPHVSFQSGSGSVGGGRQRDPPSVGTASHQRQAT